LIKSVCFNPPLHRADKYKILVPFSGIHARKLATEAFHMARPAAKRETEPMNHAVHPGSSSCERHGDTHVEPLRKYLL
jgi:hypothetical protein